MVNTRILVNEFEYFEPKTVAEAVDLLARYGKDAKILAGGTNLLVDMKLEKVGPKYLIYTGKIPELRSIKRVGSEVVVGANVTFFEMMRAPELKDCFMIREAFESVQLEIRRMGTIGGNVCNAAPTASAAPPLLALEAKVKLVSKRGSRVVPLEEVFVGDRRTSLAPDELLTEIHIPLPNSSYGAAFGEIKRKIKFAMVIGRQGNVCNYSRIAMGGDIEKPTRVRNAESLLVGKSLDGNTVKAACAAAVAEIDPENWYVREIAEYLFQKVLQEAWARAR
ncbi:MAG: FAD binding domain-containing protein [Candidatus Hadarchaeum sp.]|uniref:FAD binding domain-containing protein n=1 Tax=Candidatus Hadarchaeum sp. TaxID=2883567 RepID=UPI003D12661B